MTTTLEHAATSDRGRVRERNEDRWYANPELGLFVVSDGIGGGPAGEVASQIVVEAVAPLVAQRLGAHADLAAPDAPDRLRRALVELSDELRDGASARAGLAGMGATVVLALVGDARALVAHMGDSRAYLWREQRLERLTHDHSLVQALIDAKEISPDEAAAHPARGRLTRHVGMRGEALPEVRTVELRPGDRLLLCTDGLSDMLDDSALLEILNRAADPEPACERLAAAANRAGGADNVTALVISYLA